MSNMLRKGKRIAARKKKKETKMHTKEFYKILAELDNLAEKVLNEDEYADLREELTEENMVELLQPLTHVEIGGLEKFVLKGKLGYYGSMEKDIENAKKD